ncbi:MAG: GNAT family N-acetyltransferase [Clostridiales bacterium]|nr:GNAT family N-acetyltransferase [Clostridiales bacterium]
MRIIEITSEHRKTVDAIIKEEWAGPVIASKGHAWDTSVLPGFEAIDDDNNLCGVITYRLECDECEITTLNSLEEKQGIGTDLINAVISTAKGNHCRRLWLITTNDNTHAIRFYQRFGFTLREVHINALEKSRKLKPSIPLLGMDNIPLQHEFEFEIIL